MVKHSGEMIGAAMKEKDLKQMDLAKRIGRDQTLISRYVAGQIEVSDAAARAMAEALDIDFEELLRQLQHDRFERRREKLRTEFKEVLSKEEKADISASGDTSLVGSVEMLKEMASIPLLDSIPKNANYKSKDSGESYILPPGVNIDLENSFALRIKESSITDDKVDVGDIIIVDTGTEVKNEDRILIIIEGKPILRRIYLAGDTIFLHSPNSNEPPKVLSKGDDFRIIGKLAGCYKQF